MGWFCCTISMSLAENGAPFPLVVLGPGLDTFSAENPLPRLSSLLPSGSRNEALIPQSNISTVTRLLGQFRGTPLPPGNCAAGPEALASRERALFWGARKGPAVLFHINCFMTQTRVGSSFLSQLR